MLKVPSEIFSHLFCVALVHYGPATEQSTQRNRTRTSRYQQPIRRSKPQAANQPPQASQAARATPAPVQMT